MELFGYYCSDEMTLLASVLTFIWVHFLFTTYLKYRQERFFNLVEDCPAQLQHIIDDFTYELSLLYHRFKLWLGHRLSLFLHLQSTMIIILYGIEFLWRKSGALIGFFGFGPEYEILQSLVFVVAQELFLAVTALPWLIYSVFVDAKFGFSVQIEGEKLILRVIARVIGGVLLCSLFLPLLALTLYVIKIGGTFFFMWTWIFMFMMYLVLTYIFSDIMQASMSPLPPGALGARIEHLADTVGFPSHRIFVLKGSSQVNAFLHGFGSSTSIVLFDRLLARGPVSGAFASVYTSDEVLAVVAHEIGHWSLSHILKLFLLYQLCLFVKLSCFALFMTTPLIYLAFGFVDVQPTIIGLILISGYIMTPFHVLSDQTEIVLARRFEYEADQYAATLTDAADLRSALIKLHRDNLAFPSFDWLYSSWYHDHPPLLDRLDAIR